MNVGDRCVTKHPTLFYSERDELNNLRGAYQQRSGGTTVEVVAISREFKEKVMVVSVDGQYAWTWIDQLNPAPIERRRQP